jgi:hypothetical protein
MKNYSFTVTRCVNVAVDEAIKIPGTSFEQAEAALALLMDESDFESNHNWSISEEYDETLRQVEHSDTDESRGDTLHELFNEFSEAGLDEDQILELLSDFRPPDSFLRFLSDEERLELNGDINVRRFVRLVVASEEGEEHADDPPPTDEELQYEKRYQGFKEQLSSHYNEPLPYIVAQNMALKLGELNDFLMRYNKEMGTDLG